MIAIIDYGMGNVRSVFNALAYLGQEPCLTSDFNRIGNASHIILPGVGAFGNAMLNLEKFALIEKLRQEVLVKGKPFLGICLGLQMLAKSSYEHGFHQGLGWLDAEVRKFSFDNEEIKLPHIGWNDIKIKTTHPFFAGLKDGEPSFYFVHSYHINCREHSDTAATCEYGYAFTAAVIKDNIIATQFHPEKSQDNGIQLLENFVNWNP